MQTLRIREYRTELGVDLSNDDLAVLLSFGKQLEVVPSLVSGYDITANSWVGVIQTPTLSVEIIPKLDIPELMFMLSYTLDQRAWRIDTFAYQSRESLLDGIAAGFASVTRQALRQGVLHGYRVLEDALPVVRGRIRFDDQLRTRYGRMPPVEARYDEYTEDVEENRILRAATHKLGRLRLRSDRTRQQLRSIGVSLHNATLREYERWSIPAVQYTRLNAPFRPAIELGRLILQSLSLHNQLGSSESAAFLLDMNRLFEDFLVVALRDALGVSEFAFPQGAKGQPLWLDRARRIKLEPDISWWRGGRCRFIGDAKYKRIGEAGVVHSDVYQMLAYLTATNLSEGLLIYAAGEAEPTQHELPGGKTIEVAYGSTDGYAERCLGQGAGTGQPNRARLRRRMSSIPDPTAPATAAGLSTGTAPAYWGKMTTPTFYAFLLIGIVASCEHQSSDAPDRPTAATNREALSARLDTVLGLQLGMLMPDVREAGAAAGLQFDCFKGSELHSMGCSAGSFSSPNGKYLLGFEAGRLSLISRIYGTDWDDVPRDSIIRRHTAYGPPTRVINDSAYYSLWLRDSVYLALRCPRPTGELCSEVRGFGTLEQLEAEIPILKRHMP